MHGLLNDANKIIGFVNKVNRERMHSNHDRKTLERLECIFEIIDQVETSITV